MTRSLLLLLISCGLALPACTRSVSAPEPEGYQPATTDNNDDDDDGPSPMGDDDDDDDSTAASDDDDDDSTEPPSGDDDDSTEPPMGDDDDSTEPAGSGLCSPVGVLSCGDEIAASTLDSAATSEIDGYSCSPWSATGPELAWSFTAPEAGSVTAALSDIQAGQDLDIYVIEDAAGCDATDCIAYGNTETTFEAVAGATYHLVVDGYTGSAGTFTLAVTCGTVPVGDDDDAVGDDDDAVGDDDDATGDDDDATGDDDDATSEPIGSAGVCSPDLALTGPSVDSWANNGTGSTNAIDTYSCVGWDESGPEYVYEYTATVNGQATVHIDELPDSIIEYVLGSMDNLDVFILSPAGGCSANSCVAYHDDTVSWTVTAGSTWYVVVDGYQGDSSPFDITITEAGNGPLPPPSTESSCADGLDDDADGLVDCDDSDCGSASACQVGTCIPARIIDCGGSDSWNNGATGSWELIDTYACTGWNESGPEVTYLFQPTAAAQVTVDIANMSADLDVFVSSDAGTGCAGAGCAAFGNTGASFAVQAGESWYVTVDGFNGAVSDFDLTVTCN